MEAIANYVIEAWKLRSTALAGRGTNGGDPVV
jgi:NAD(P)H-hydrate repair Nnr-like enzyme with NAD(P)H-hydrate epimerase domain